MAEEEKPPVSEVKEPEVTEEKADSTEKKLEKLTVEEKQEDSVNTNTKKFENYCLPFRLNSTHNPRQKRRKK